MPASPYIYVGIKSTKAKSSWKFGGKVRILGIVPLNSNFTNLVLKEVDLLLDDLIYVSGNNEDIIRLQIEPVDWLPIVQVETWIV